MSFLGTSGSKSEGLESSGPVQASTELRLNGFNGLSDLWGFAWRAVAARESGH